MNVLQRLTLRNLKLNRKRTIVTLIGIILSGAMICGVSTLAASFQDLLVRSAKLTDGAHHVSLYDVPYEDSQVLSNHAYTETSMLSKDLGFARLTGSKHNFRPYLMIKGYDQTALEHLPLKLTDGEFPDEAGEIVLSEEVFYSGGVEYRIGDQLTLEIGERVDQGNVLSQEQLTETETLNPQMTATYTVTGFIETPRFEKYTSPGFGAVAFLDTSRLKQADTVNVSLVMKKPAEIFEHVPQLAEQLEIQEVVYNNELLKWMGITDNDRVNAMFTSIELIIILIVVIGSVSVIYNAFAISVSERKKQFGMLSSVGATASQIRKMVFFEGLLLGLIGIPLGIVSGIAGISVTLMVVNHLMDGSVLNAGVPLRLTVSPYTLLLSIGFIALTIFLSAYIPARRAAKISPIEAIRLNTDINVKGKQLKTSKLIRHLFGIEGELALKNLKRQRKRYRATVFSLFISIVLFISFSSFITYSFTSSSMYYSDIPYDIAIEKHDIPVDDQIKLYEDIIALEEVTQSSLVRHSLGQLRGLDPSQLGSYIQETVLTTPEAFGNDLFSDPQGGYQIGIHLIALGDQMFQTYVQSLGLHVDEYVQVQHPKGILVNRNMIDDPVMVEFEPTQFQAGEAFVLSDPFAQSEASTAAYPIEVGAVTDVLPFGVHYTGITSVNMIVSDDVLDGFLTQMGEEAQQIAEQIKLYVDVEEGADREAFEETVRGLSARSHPNEYLMFYDSAAHQEQIGQMRMVISIFLYGFISLITLIGITNIFNTINTNIGLRRREFAMLRSIGLTPSSFNKIIRYESLFYGIHSLLLGLPVGVLLSVWIYSSIGHVFQFSFLLPWKEIIICIIGVFVIVFMTMLHASRKLKHESMIEALKTENL